MMNGLKTYALMLLTWGLAAGSTYMGAMDPKEAVKLGLLAAFFGALRSALSTETRKFLIDLMTITAAGLRDQAPKLVLVAVALGALAGGCAHTDTSAELQQLHLVYKHYNKNVVPNPTLPAAEQAKMVTEGQGIDDAFGKMEALNK